MCSNLFATIAAQKSPPETKSVLRPLAYTPKSKSPSKRVPRPLATTPKKCGGANKRPVPLFREKSPETNKVKITSLPSVSKPKMKNESPRLSVSEQDDLVGCVHESDAQHWKRHYGDPSSRTCGRCHFIRNKAELLRDFPWLSP